MHGYTYYTAGCVVMMPRKKNLVLSYCNYIHACLGRDLQESTERPEHTHHDAKIRPRELREIWDQHYLSSI